MNALNAFAKKQAEFNDRQSAAIDGIAADLKSLNDTIAELQASVGTDEDKALANDAQAKAQALTERLEALDKLTPPTPPA